MDKINCKIHGESSSVEFSKTNNSVQTDVHIPPTILKIVCFMCYMEKITEGLEDFSKNKGKV